MLCHALAINILRRLALKSNETSQYSARSTIHRKKSNNDIDRLWILTCTRPSVTHIRLYSVSQMRAIQPTILRHRIGTGTWPLSMTTTACDVTLGPSTPVCVATIYWKIEKKMSEMLLNPRDYKLDNLLERPGYSSINLVKVTPAAPLSSNPILTSSIKSSFIITGNVNCNSV